MNEKRILMTKNPLNLHRGVEQCGITAVVFRQIVEKIRLFELARQGVLRDDWKFLDQAGAVRMLHELMNSGVCPALSVLRFAHESSIIDSDSIYALMTVLRQNHVKDTGKNHVQDLLRLSQAYEAYLTDHGALDETSLLKKALEIVKSWEDDPLFYAPPLYGPGGEAPSQ